MTDAEKAVKRVREFNEPISQPESLQWEDVLALLAAYDARGREIEALKRDHDNAHERCLEVAEQCDALRAWVEKAGHRQGCLALSGLATSADLSGTVWGQCTCGLTEALKGSET